MRGYGCRPEAASSPERQSKNRTPSQTTNRDKRKSEGISGSSKANAEPTPEKASKAKHKKALSSHHVDHLGQKREQVNAL